MHFKHKKNAKMLNVFIWQVNKCRSTSIKLFQIKMYFVCIFREAGHGMYQDLLE